MYSLSFISATITAQSHNTFLSFTLYLCSQNPLECGLHIVMYPHVGGAYVLAAVQQKG